MKSPVKFTIGIIALVALAWVGMTVYPAIRVNLLLGDLDSTDRAEALAAMEELAKAGQEGKHALAERMKKNAKLWTEPVDEVVKRVLAAGDVGREAVRYHFTNHETDWSQPDGDLVIRITPAEIEFSDNSTHDLEMEILYFGKDEIKISKYHHTLTSIDREVKNPNPFSAFQGGSWGSFSSGRPPKWSFKSGEIHKDRLKLDVSKPSASKRADGWLSATICALGDGSGDAAYVGEMKRIPVSAKISLFKPYEYLKGKKKREKIAALRSKPIILIRKP